MKKEGVFKNGKVYTHFDGYTVYEFQRTMDWWPSENQEITFEVENDKAYIKSLGKILKPEDAERYCRSF